MKNLYELIDDNGECILSCEDIVECYDFSGTGNSYLFSLIGISKKDVSHLLMNQFVTLKNSQFDDRLSLRFLVKNVIEYDSVLLLHIENLQRGVYYRLGALSLLKVYAESNDRIWLDMKKDLKRIYLSACMLVNGERDIPDNTSIVIEGKFIHDYYSFFCEIGFLVFGTFGYVGDGLYAFDDYLSRANNMSVIWKDHEIALKAMDNAVPEGYEGCSSYDLLSTLELYCHVVLE